MRAPRRTIQLAAKSRRVLVINDDDAASADRYRAVLANQGVVTLHAPEGVAALANLENRRPEAILLELRADNIDAFTALNEFARNPLTDDIPVFVVGITEMPRAIPHSVRLVRCADPDAVANELLQHFTCDDARDF